MTESDLYCYSAQVTRVIDGDTIEVKFDLGFKVQLADVAVRLRDINTPETHGVKHESLEYAYGMRAKQRLIELVLAKTVVIRTLKHDNDRLYDKYGRVLGDIFVALPDGTRGCVNNILISEGLAK